MQAQSTQPKNLTTASMPLAVVHHVPLWVKGIIVLGAILFLIQISTFPSSLSDAVQKSRASASYATGQYLQAIDQYQELRTRYPTDEELIKQLGFAQYRTGQYREALGTFVLLEGVSLPKGEADEINAVISDIVVKLDQQTHERG